VVCLLGVWQSLSSGEWLEGNTFKLAEQVLGVQSSSGFYNMARLFF